ncbi:hypothetical protein FRB90_001472, partial [Tulasnella sp. 427]
ASYSRPTRSNTQQAPTTNKALPSAPGKATVVRSNTTAGAGSGNTTLRYYQKPQPAAPGPAVPSKNTLPGIPPKTTAYISATAPAVKRSNTTPIRSNTTPTRQPLPAPSSNRVGQSSSRRADVSGAVPPPPPKATATAGALSRSKSERDRPAQTYTTKNEAVRALKAPLPAIPQGAVAKNLVLASEDNARVLDSGLPNVTSSHIVRIAESNGKCLEEASAALFGRHAPPEERIVWNHTADRDKGMQNLLEWVDKVKWGLASLGLHKFMATKQRGALIFNVNGRLSNDPKTPAVDWFTFADAQRTLDKQLQKYIGEYNPAEYVLVFTFRVMRGGQVMHMWGKKLAIPQTLPVTYATEIRDALKKVNKKRLEVLTEDPAPKRSLSITKWLKRKIKP